MCVYKSNSNKSNPSFIFERTVQDVNSNDLLFAPPVSASNTARSSRSNTARSSRSNSFYNLQTASPIPFSSGRTKSSSSRKNSNNVLSPLDNVMPNSRSNSTSSSLAHQEYVLNPISNMHHHHSRRRTLENSVAPALDASCSIVNDENTDLTDVDMVYSRRPSSTIGLNMALLGRTNSATLPSASSPVSPDLKLSRSYSHSAGARPTLNNVNNTGMTTASGEPKSRILRFYSYVDMLNDEKLTQTNNAPSTRPSLKSQPNSCPFILKQPQPQPSYSSSATTTFSNPFTKSTEFPSGSPYVSPQQNARRYSTNASKSPPNQSSSILLQRKSTLSNAEHATNPGRNPRFQIESSDSEEEEDLAMDMLEPSFRPASSLRSSANFLASNPEIANQVPLSSSSSFTTMPKSMSLSNDPSFVSSSNTLTSDNELRIEKVSEVLKKKVSNSGFSSDINN
ncbi:hypothetical protein N7582_004895 [Saccharomyces uvarum]|uniref:Mlf3p n=1 Tax=Saccharomyces uvarum TaxID=230603 RepID=A0AA35J675_SACUV|nr:hypothetical protein N7582_004895 [Saccharomyces uvarum]CAI4050358.1 hypothetical protein SUVC_14G2440 [Saccharomyces uvarum]